jgi:ABC-type lipoprotein release transport system permease subunit
MNLQSFILILSKQFKHKWGRFVLAAGGITIGIWAISLTVSLSLGLANSLITAVNSQSFARNLTITRNKTGGDSFDFSQRTDIALSLNEMNTIKDKVPSINEITPSVTSNYYFKTAERSCFDLNKKNLEQEQKNSEMPTSDTSTKPLVSNMLSGINVNAAGATSNTNNNFIKECPKISISSQLFQEFYLKNKNNWHGQTSAPKNGEIVMCFTCGNQIELSTKLQVSKPSEMIGKNINLEYVNITNNVSPDGMIEYKNMDIFTPKEVENSITQTYKIVAVVDDSKSQNNNNFVSFDFGSPIFLPTSTFISDMSKIHKVEESKLGFKTFIAFLDSYQNLDSTFASLKELKYSPNSAAKDIVSSITIFFNIISVILGLFGIIILIAAVFGIINVMTISVLERQKEIGILKAMGAKNMSIFTLFVLESAVIGVLGWLFGIILAFASGYALTSIFKILLTQNPKWAESLNNLNIDALHPIFPWYVLVATFVLALFFTILSGLFPAINAARKNPVDVLRTE